MQKIDTPKSSPAKQKQTVSKQGSKRVTRSQTVAKGNLEDILHAIDIEEIPIVQAKDIEDGGRKLKKGKTRKKLEFADDDVGFIYQPRKPMTKHARKVMESSKETEKINETAQPPSIIDISSPAKEELVINKERVKRKLLKNQKLKPLKNS